MQIEECLKNVRCDKISCHKMAKYNLNLSSYKGSTCLCEDCFNLLFEAMQKIKKPTQKQKTTTKGNN